MNRQPHCNACICFGCCGEYREKTRAAFAAGEKNMDDFWELMAKDCERWQADPTVAREGESANTLRQIFEELSQGNIVVLQKNSDGSIHLIRTVLVSGENISLADVQTAQCSLNGNRGVVSGNLTKVVPTQ